MAFAEIQQEYSMQQSNERKKTVYDEVAKPFYTRWRIALYKTANNKYTDVINENRIFMLFSKHRTYVEAEKYHVQ